MRHRLSAIVGAIAVTGFVASLGSSAIAAPSSGHRGVSARDTTAAQFVADSEECAFLTQINTYRKANGLGDLKISTTLAAAAEDHSLDMAAKNYFSHTFQNGTSWSANIANHGYPSNSYRAENIAAGNALADATFNQWKNSAGHNANMLSANYNVIGIGRAYGASSTYKWYWTTTFGSLTDTVYTGCGGGGVITPPASTQLKIVGGGRLSGSASSTLAYDANLATAWSTITSSTPRYSHIYFDLGAVKTIASVKWYFATAGNADKFTIQVSNNKSTWTTISSQTNGVSGKWSTITWKGSTRYLRFYFTNPNGDKVLGNLAEVQIWS